MRIAILIHHMPDADDPRDLDLVDCLIERTPTALLEPVDEVALDIALRAQDEDPSVDVVAIALGAKRAHEALRRCLSMGADRALHILAPPRWGADALGAARPFAAAIRRVMPDLVIAGDDPADGEAGLVPAALAELLAWPCLLALEEVRVGSVAVSGVLRVDGVETELSAALPAIVTVAARAAEARLPTLYGIVAARRKPFDNLARAEVGEVGLVRAESIVLSAQDWPDRAGGARVGAASAGRPVLRRNLV